MKRVEGSFQLNDVHNSTQLYKRPSLSECCAFQLTTLVRSNIFVASVLKEQESTKLLKELIWFSHSCQRWINLFYLSCETKHVALDSCPTMDGITSPECRAQEGGSVSRVNIGRLITTSVTSRHTSMFFKMAGNFLVRHFCKR